MHSAIPNKWLKFVLSSTNPDEEAYKLFELGASGVTVHGTSRLDCFFQGRTLSPEALSQKISSLGFEIINYEFVVEENWNAKCEAILAPLKVDNIEIIPVADTNSSELTKANPAKIFIIPGLGFGTGHHASTRLMLQLLQNLKNNAFSPQQAMDLGTGSGILAIAMQRLFAIKIDALDIDPLALENATDNAGLNHCSSQINFMHGSIDIIKTKYCLISANIYAEVLCTLRNDFARCLSKNAHLVLSGIMLSLSPSVESAFAKPAFELLEKITEDGWVGLSYRYLGE